MITRSAEETTAAGRAFAQRLRPGDLVLLEGPLGSGKTTFVQGIAEGLGAETSATSPSFVIAQEYSLGRRHETVGSREARTTDRARPTASTLRHLDLYRLSDLSVDAERIGLAELLNDPVAITVVEWAERLPAESLHDAPRMLHVRFGHGEESDERTLDIQEIR